MPTFKKTLSDPHTSFTPVQPRRPADTSAERDQAVTNLATVAAGAAGKAYATSQGAEQAGVDQTLEQVNDQARQIDDRINQALTAEQNEVAGPLQPQRVAEIKDTQLSEFATNDRTLLALRDRGVISTTEAKARRTMNLKKALSNPINNLFRKDFLNAAGDLTGGGSGAVDALFAPTAQEKEDTAIQEAQIKAKAEYEAEVTGRMAKTGKSRVVVANELAQSQEDADRVADLNRIKTERELNQIEADELFARSRSGVSRGNMGMITEWNQSTGGKGLDANQMSSVSRSIEGQYQQLVTNLNSTPGLTGAARDAELSRIDKWKAGQNAMLKSYDAAEYDKREQAELDTLAQKIGWAAMPEVMVMKSIDPKLFDVFLKSGGNIEAIMNRTLGEGRGTQFTAATEAMRSLTALSEGGKIGDKKAVMEILNTANGMQYIAEESENPMSKVSDQLKSIYADQPEATLGAYNGMGARLQAAKSESFRGQVVTAFGIANDKMQFLKRSAAGGEDITVSTSKSIMTPHGQRSVKVYLNIPDAMEENQGELKQMYRTIEKHTWMWGHVSDQYDTPADAFNGYIRGEWEPNTDLDKVLPARERPSDMDRQVLTEDQREQFKLKPDVRPEDVTELQELIAKETPPTDEEEDRLIELLEQRVAIRDKKRTGGKPVDPRPQVPEKQAFDTTEKPDFQQRLKDFENNKQLPADVSGFDGSVWKPHKSVEGGTNTIAYGHKLTPAEAKSGIVTIGGEKVDVNQGITDEQAETLFQEDLKRHSERVSKKFPNAEGDTAEVLTMMDYQGVDISTWPNSRRALKEALKSGEEGDWLAAQSHILNSKWATEQTPERALQTVHMLFPETDIEILQKLQEKFMDKRGVKRA